MAIVINPQLSSPLFRTPLEIRYRIYDFALEAERPIPTNLDNAKEVERYAYKLVTPTLRLHYPTAYESPDIYLRLLCKKTLYEVATMRKARMSDTKSLCKLDLMTDRKHFLPTWILPPRQVKGVEYDLEISFRLFEITSQIPWSGWEGWCGVISAPLTALLIHLVHYGPRFLPSAREPRPEPLRFNAITMAVTLPDSKTLSYLQFEKWKGGFRLEGSHERALRFWLNMSTTRTGQKFVLHLPAGVEQTSGLNDHIRISR